jgi:hypothetical protein
MSPHQAMVQQPLAKGRGKNIWGLESCAAFSGAAIDNMEMNEHSCVPIKLYL